MAASIHIFRVELKETSAGAAPSLPARPVKCVPFEGHAHLRLDRMLAAIFPSWSRNTWSRRISEGRILVLPAGARSLASAQKVRPSRRLREGEGIVVTEMPEDSPPPARRPYVVSAFNGVAFLHKPAGLLSHPASPLGVGTLIQQAGELLATRDLHLCGRLDRFTSGLVPIATSARAKRNFERACGRGDVTKTYLAVLEGRLEHDCWLVESSVSAEPGGGPRMRLECRRVQRLEGTPARRSPRPLQGGEMLVKVIARSDSNTLVLVRVHSASKHQIRLVCSRVLEAPVMRDKLYGRSGMDPAYYSTDAPPTGMRAWLDDWHALHCAMIEWRGTRIVSLPSPPLDSAIKKLLGTPQGDDYLLRAVLL